MGVVWPDDAFIEFTQLFILNLGMQLLKSLTVTVYIACLVP
jgi:hypothetical protein